MRGDLWNTVEYEEQRAVLAEFRGNSRIVKKNATVHHPWYNRKEKI